MAAVVQWGGHIYLFHLSPRHRTASQGKKVKTRKKGKIGLAQPRKGIEVETQRHWKMARGGGAGSEGARHPCPGRRGALAAGPLRPPGAGRLRLHLRPLPPGDPPSPLPLQDLSQTESRTQSGPGLRVLGQRQLDRETTVHARTHACVDVLTCYSHMRMCMRVRVCDNAGKMALLLLLQGLCRERGCRGALPLHNCPECMHTDCRNCHDTM